MICGATIFFHRPTSCSCCASLCERCSSDRCSCQRRPTCARRSCDLHSCDLHSCDLHSCARRSCVRRIRTATASYHHFLNYWTVWLQPLGSSVLQGFVARIARFAHNTARTVCVRLYITEF